MWHILFQAFVKYHLHSKHLNKILFEIINFGVLQQFSETIKNTSSSTKKIQIDFKKKKKNASNYYYTTQNSHTYKHYKQEINLHDMSDEDSSIVGGK